MRAHRSDTSRTTGDSGRPVRAPRRRNVAGTIRRHPTDPEAVLDLQRTAGNKVTRRFLAAHAGASAAPVVQRAPYGLEKQPVQDKYVDQAVKLRKTQPDMALKEFVDTLMAPIAAELKASGVPFFAWTFVTGDGALGEFNSKTWLVEVNVSKFSKRPGVTPTLVKHLTDDEVTEVVGTLYHESRHTDQDLLVIRSLLDQKKSPAQIVATTTIRKDVVDAIKATRFTTKLDPAQVAHAGRMFDVMYGAHREFLTFLMAHADAYEALGKLAETGSTLSPAAPHIPTFARWQPAVVQPKIKKLAAIKKPTQVEKDLLAGYRAVDKGLTALLGDWKTAAKKSPTPDEVDNVRVSAEDTRKAMQAVYENLESEADAFRVEGLVKTAFGTKLAKP
ncbi:hypothetical protein Cch01nite_37090 [Cellulomonas chitinilytica]|uniref:Uncharacterized protein n=1 Tax=Cellulomonas chitinilytica TaxID=398759 RepID=A0A919U0K8_9CELL|nr:hypothetical protein [Cellulomonas chitinilytica]GIG22985.1 hypothetical protein Cch01nite_37090 [Cellulomonas chitinilytica]